MALAKAGPGRLVRIALEAAALFSSLLLAHLLLDLDPRQVPDFGMPDALFYSRAGQSLAAGEGYAIEVNASALPPKFPPGTSLLLAAGYAAGAEGRAGALRVSQLLAAVLGTLVWWGARRIGGAWAGLAALVALQGSLCLTAFRNQMASDVPACLVPLGLALLLARPGPDRHRLWGAGLLAGLGLWVRYPLVVTAPCLLLLLEPRRHGFPGRALHLCLGALLPIATLLAWHWAAFGHLFRTGYGLWLPDFHQADKAVFSLVYALQGPALGAMRGPNWSYYAGVLGGRGSLLHTWPVAFAGLVGLPLLLARTARAEARRVAGFTLLFAALSYLFYAAYFFQEARLLLPLAPLLCVVGAAGAASAASALARGRKPWIQAVATLAPLLLVPVPIRFIANVSTQKDRFILESESLAAAELGRLVPPGALLLTGRDLLLTAGEAPRVKLLPLSLRQEWAFALAWRDRRLAHPEEDEKTTGTWVEALAEGSLPAAAARALLAPPLPANLDYLEQEVDRGRPLYFEGDGAAWALLERRFAREAVPSPVLELYRLRPIGQ